MLKIFRFLIKLVVIVFSFLGFCSANVYISEVYFQGSDEWIELYSPDGYTGPITIAGAKSSNLNFDISISAGGIIILADSGNNILDKSLVQKFGAGFSITDSNAINISLQAGNFSQNFVVDQSQIPKTNNKTSFSTIFIDGQPNQIIPTPNSYNSPDNATPGQIISQNTPSSSSVSSINSDMSSLSSEGMSSLSSEEVSSQNSDISSENSSQIESSSNESVSSQSDSSDSAVSSFSQSSNSFSSISSISSSIASPSTISSSSSFSSSSIFSSTSLQSFIQISEINPTTHFYPEYIEIFSPLGYSGSIYISGAGKTQKTIDVNMKSGEFYILSDSASWFLNQNFYLVPGIVLNDKSGEIKISAGDFSTTQSYSGNTNYKSWSFTTPSGLANQTPGFDNKFEKYIKPISKNLSCGIKIQNKNSFYAGDSINFIAQLEGNDIQNSGSEKCNWQIDGKDLGRTCNPSYNSMFQPGISNISLTISTSDGQVCQTYVYLNLPQKTNTSSTTLSPPNVFSASNSVQNTTNPLLLSCYNPSIFSQSMVKITSALPNPKGKDDREKVILSSSGNLNISGYYIKSGSKKTFLSGDIFENKEIIGNLGLKNKNSCVYLYNSENFIISQFCWNEPKESEILSQSYQNLEQVPQFFIQDFDFKDGCLVYNSTIISCESQTSSSSTLKDEKYVSLKSKYDALNEKFKELKISEKEKYQKLKDKFDAYKKAQKDKYDKLNEKLKTQKIKDKQKYDLLNEKYKKYKADMKIKIEKLKADAKKKYDAVVLKRKKKIESEKKLQATNKILRDKNSNLTKQINYQNSFFTYLKSKYIFEKQDISLYSLGQKSIASGVVINGIHYQITSYQQLQRLEKLNLSKTQVDTTLNKFKQENK